MSEDDQFGVVKMFPSSCFQQEDDLLELSPAQGRASIHLGGFTKSWQS